MVWPTQVDTQAINIEVHSGLGHRYVALPRTEVPSDSCAVYRGKDARHAAEDCFGGNRQ